MRTIYDNVSVGSILAVYNSSAAVVSTSPVVDTKGYGTAVLRVNASATGAVSAIGGGVSTSVVLQESATSTGTFTTALDNSGATIGGTVVATTTAVLGSYRIEGLGQNRLRYLRYTLTANFPAGVNAPSALIHTLVGVIELGKAYNSPVATTPGGTMPPATSNT